MRNTIKGLLRGGPDEVGKAIYSITGEERHEITRRFCEQCDWDARLTRGRPNYSRKEGNHLIVHTMNGYWHVQRIQRGDPDDWALLVDWLVRQCCGEWTIYGGGPDR